MFKIQITGFDKVIQQLDDASKALESLDGHLGTVNFNPDDPASIEAAIQKVEGLVDDKIALYKDNPMIASFAASMKDTYRQSIVARAAASRLSDNQE